MPTILTESTAKAVRPVSDDSLDHLYCATDHDISLCGLDISGVPEGDAGTGEDLRVICADLCDVGPCPVCREFC